MVVIMPLVLLWTVIWSGGDTVLQYGSQAECQAAVTAGLPYLDVPVRGMDCAPRPALHPHEKCGDGTIAYGARCLVCMRDGEMVTSSLCEAHGYKAVGR